MEKKEGATPVHIIMVAILCVAIGLLIFAHAHPGQTLIGMLIGIFVLVVLVDGGRQRVLSKRLGPDIQLEIDAGRVYVTDVPAKVISLLKDGKKIEAIKILKGSSGLGLIEAKNRLDEIQLRLTMGQAIKSRYERD